MKNLIGKRFGEWLVLGRATNRGKVIFWLCRCICGVEKEIRGTCLTSGNTTNCGCLRSPDLTGQRFGKLIVLGKINKNKNNQSIYLCKCDCGKEKKIRRSHLLDGRIKSCGCYRNECFSNRRKIEYGLSAKRRVYYNYISHARIKKVSFNISFEQFLELTQKKCHYCDEKPSNIFKDRCPNGYFTYNGLDRIDNIKGYTLDNVVPCCHTCNMAKRSMPYNEFIEWINKAYNNLHKENL